MLCEHFFCMMPARAYSRNIAKYRVVQNFDNGISKTTYVCESDMAAMVSVLTASDTVIKL